ncbi:MAG: hypothetical protein QM770_22855 [Tepidisphaeraceae bacterium]
MSLTASRFAVAVLSSAVALLSSGSTSSATVVFADHYASRPDNQDIFNTAPTTTSPGVGTYGAVLTFPYGSRVDPFSVMGKTLKFNTSSGADPQMMYLPAPYVFGADKVRVTVRAAFDEFNAGGFNNFAIGFAKYDLGVNGNIFTDHLLVQQNQVELHFPGTNTTTSVPYSFSPKTFYQFELMYDPSKAGIAGLQPYALAINGVDVPISVTGATTYSPLTSFDYVAFGGRFSNGNTSRYLTDFSLETFAVPEPTSIALALGATALTLRRKR